MKLLFLLPLVFLFTVNSPLNAQVGNQSNNNSFYSKSRVYISIDKPVRGQAQEDKTIYIDPDKGSFAYVIVDNYPNKFSSSSIKLKTYKKIAGKYEKLDEQNYDIDNSFTYTYIKYSFMTAGEFAFDVYDGNGTFINSGFVTVQNNTTTSTGTGGGKYDKSKAFVSIEVPVAGVAKESKSITIDRTNGSYAYIVVDNYPNNFNVDQINLKSYRKINGKYEKLKDELYNISADQYYTYIKYSFFTEGEYAFDIYDKANTFINTAYVTVSYK